MKKRKLLIGVGVLATIIVTAVIFNACRTKAPIYSIESVKVKKGNVSNTVTATGTLQALKTVDVGTQVSGVILNLYADYNSVVKKGQLLAELDKTPLLATLNNAQASLDDSKAELTYKSAQYNRIKALYEKQLVAQTEYDEALYLYSKALAASKISQSNYEKAKINLDYATISSPIDGVVLSREVSEGQTVAASFSAPTLFSIARDLTQMQVEANIDEADIGEVKKGQRVEFTVDAYSTMKFAGKVTEIRLQSVTTSNVVTYTVIVEAPNPDKKLMPGMTANIVVYVAEAIDVLTIPVKATQFRPDSAALASFAKSSSEHSEGHSENLSEKKPADGSTGSTSGNKPAEPGQMPTMVWVKSKDGIHPVPIETGVSDWVNIEVKKGLKEGDEVITSINSSLAAIPQASAGGSPFMPKPPKR